MKRLIRKWLGLKDTHYMTCSELKIFGELLEVSDPCLIHEGNVINVNGMNLIVTGHALKVERLA